MTDTEWFASQQRRRNLASYQTQPVEKKRRGKAMKFTPKQLEIATAALDRQTPTREKAA